jgi:hypothetical protein
MAISMNGYHQWRKQYRNNEIIGVSMKENENGSIIINENNRQQQSA